MVKAHNFHIPVMGIGFTIDTPLKIGHFGINSVVSIVDDILIEKMRKYHSFSLGLDYTPITEKDSDYRAHRVTEYLNLLNTQVNINLEKIKSQEFKEGTEITKYFEMLPDSSELKKDYNSMLASINFLSRINKQDELRSKMIAGSIDVNIMTKVDKTNYKKDGTPLDIIYNDAHASLRGYANSNLESSIIFSAGMSPRLYSYMENFEDFYPDSNGYIKKKIVLKVSDYKSALIQGKFLAKKGLWVSEYRIESGLNCGGHAFATNGFLMGPILEEFVTGREDLTLQSFELLENALKAKNKPMLQCIPKLAITAQGGVGTNNEHDYLIKHYKLDSIGWGTPFLVVPEATNVDDKTIKLLCDAEEDDLYLSDISPLGVPFNSIKGNSKDFEKRKNILKNRPGSACPKKFLALNGELTDTGICTASRQYQFLKLKELDNEEISPEEYNKKYNKIIDKACICVGLGTSALLVNNIDTRTEGEGVSICPGPNMAYFDKTCSLKTMIGHIYGSSNVIHHKSRPHMFMKELDMYIQHFKGLLKDITISNDGKGLKKINQFKENLIVGINYYKSRIKDMASDFDANVINEIKRDLQFYESALVKGSVLDKVS